MDEIFKINPKHIKRNAASEEGFNTILHLIKEHARKFNVIDLELHFTKEKGLGKFSVLYDLQKPAEFC